MTRPTEHSEEAGSAPAPTAARRSSSVRAGSGALAGVASTVGFAAIHDLFISDIWGTLPIMALAGALCGLCIAWSYGLLCAQPSITGWLRYNVIFVAMLGLLGAASVIVFEPTTTLAAVIEANEPPAELITTAAPMTITFALVSAATLSALYGRRWSHHAAVLATVTVVVLFLGLNVSAIGLVDIPTDSTTLVAVMFGLTLVLALLYVVVFIALERQALRRQPTDDRGRSRWRPRKAPRAPATSSRQHLGALRVRG